MDILAPRDGSIQMWDHDEKSTTVAVDRQVSEAKASDYDGLVLPGGVRNADHLRIDQESVRFVTEVSRRSIPIGVICHGGWILIEAGAVNGKTMTSYPSLLTDLQNAGARWADEEVVNDHGLVSSRRPADLPAFNTKIIEEFSEGVHERKAA